MYFEIVKKIRNILKEHHKFYDESLPMIASENISSALVREIVASDFQHRYAEGDIGRRYYQGCEYIDEIEKIVMDLSRKLFECNFVEYRPISGTIANLAAYASVAKYGDSMISLSVKDGGHISHTEISAAGILGLKLYYFEFDSKRMNIDVDKSIEKIRKNKPKIINLGASLFLFPHPVKEFREIADEIDAVIIYDASHVLGLIAGKQFQKPLKEGAHIVTSSHHKTFFGPQGGLIMTNDEELYKRVKKKVFPGLVSNHHLHHKAALAVALAEMLEFGERYAKQVIINAKTLAEELYNHGFDVLCSDYGFTESHQIAIDVSKLGGGAKVAKRLEKANIIVNKNLLPWDDLKNVNNPSGIRIGVQEITRLGMKENEMKIIAELFKRLLIDNESESKIKQEVINLRKKFKYIEYSFVKSPAYKYYEFEVLE